MMSETKKTQQVFRKPVLMWWQNKIRGRKITKMEPNNVTKVAVAMIIVQMKKRRKSFLSKGGMTEIF